MEHQHHHKKTKQRRHISSKRKEPIAALSVGILLVALLIVFGIGVFMIRDFVNFANTPKSTDITVIKVDKPAPKKLDAVVLGTSISQGDPAFQPMPDKQFIIIDVDIVHNLDEPKWLSPLLESYVINSTGTKYTMSPVGLSRPFDAREYKIGEHAKGELSYMVPNRDSGLKWCYEIASPSLKSCTEL